MTPKNVLDIHNRNDFRDWLIKNSATEKECWIAVKEEKHLLLTLCGISMLLKRLYALAG